MAFLSYCCLEWSILNQSPKLHLLQFVFLQVEKIFKHHGWKFCMKLKMGFKIISRFLTSKHYMIFWVWYFLLLYKSHNRLCLSIFWAYSRAQKLSSCSPCYQEEQLDGQNLGPHSSSAVQFMITEPKGSAWPKKEPLIIYKLGVYLGICIWKCIQFCAPVFVGHAADFSGSALCCFSKRSNPVIKILFLAHFESYWFSWFIPLKFTFLL